MSNRVASIDIRKPRAFAFLLAVVAGAIGALLVLSAIAIQTASFAVAFAIGAAAFGAGAIFLIIYAALVAGLRAANRELVRSYDASSVFTVWLGSRFISESRQTFGVRAPLAAIVVIDDGQLSLWGRRGSAVVPLIAIDAALIEGVQMSTVRISLGSSQDLDGVLIALSLNERDASQDRTLDMVLMEGVLPAPDSRRRALVARIGAASSRA